MDDQSIHTGRIDSDFLIEESEGKEFLNMLDDIDTWSREKAQRTSTLLRSLINRFKRPNLQHGSCRDKIVVFAETSTGEIITLDDIMPDSMVEELKLKIQMKEGISLDQQHLIFLGKELEDGGTLLDYNIVDKSHVKLAISGVDDK